jgi:hypothetical protein
MNINIAYINTNFNATYFLGDAQKNAWIGFSDAAVQNTWVWADSTVNDFTAWLSGIDYLATQHFKVIDIYVFRSTKWRCSGRLCNNVSSYEWMAGCQLHSIVCTNMWSPNAVCIKPVLKRCHMCAIIELLLIIHVHVYKCIHWYNVYNIEKFVLTPILTMSSIHSTITSSICLFAATRP